MTTYPLTQTTNSILAQAAATGISDRRVLHSNSRNETLAYILQHIDTSVMVRHLTFTVDDKHSMSFVASSRSFISLTDVSFARFSDLINLPLNPGDLDRVCELVSNFSDLDGPVRMQVKPVDGTIDPAQSGLPAQQLAHHLNMHPEHGPVLDRNVKFDSLLVDAKDYILAVRRMHEDWQLLHDGLDGLGSITHSADKLVRDPDRISKIMKREDSLFLSVSNDMDLAIGIVLLEDGPAVLLVSSDATTALAGIWSS
ncbi:MAG: hypothetical protein ABJD13_14440 [Paracoccaceae bacterium]